MYNVDDLVVVKHNGKKYLAVVTKVTHESYFQCVTEDGTVLPSVYVGYAIPLNKTYPLSRCLKEMKKMYP